MKAIGEIAEVFDGPHATPEKIEVGPYFLSISSLINGSLDLSKSAHLSETDYIKWTKRVTPQEGDLLFSYETRLGEAALMPKGIKACLGRRMGLLRPDKSKVIPEYLLYTYLSPAFQGVIVANTITGATVDRIALNELPKFRIRIPALSEQKSVAKLLSSIDKKIEINNRINAELEAMAKTLYDYWFVQFDFPDENGKPYKSSGGKMLYSNELKREIPAGWELKSLSDLTSVLTGKEDANFSNPNGKYSYFTCGEEILRCNEYVFDGKAVLVAGNGNFNVKMYHGKFNAYQRTYVLIPNDEQFYALLYFAVINRIDSITKCSRGSIVKFMTKGDLADIKMSMPKSNKCSDLLVSVINNLLLSTLAYKKENQRLAALRDWLLPMLMNGQVRVDSAADDLYSPEQSAGTRQV
ncbi:MAG: restriction endonuclease subunit S [Candidatus Thiothrix sulfatifontis]|nr:MAG: restriction endonuclease subunit S [Candidatus Thiothrix sulfatifontis]